MKKLISLLFVCSSILFANNTFEVNKQYTCLNTHSIQQGQQVDVNPTEAAKKPFVFKIKEQQLVTADNVVFDFKMKRGPMSSYSNKDYMLLLTPNMQVGLVPRESKGSVQFYFSCTKRL